MKYSLVALLVIHGLIHAIGFAIRPKTSSGSHTEKREKKSLLIPL